MPRVDCVVECPVHDSFRVQQVAGMFDVSLETKSRESFAVELPADDEPWQIGVIVGPSGSGKSTIARQAYGERLKAVTEWPADRAVVDCFGERSIKDITAMLTAVGFSSPPAWVRPYPVLSNGQKFRCDLAKAMLEGGDLIAFDEFTSVVDRTVAKIGSAAISKAIRSGRACQKFVAVSCHYDIIDWLEPDWVLDMASGQLARGRLWRRPPISLRIYRTSHRHWRLFAKHHYLDSKDIPGSVCYVAEIDDSPACFVAVRHSAGHVGVKRISRIVTLPDFQGVGVGMATLNAVADMTLKSDGVKTVTITTGHPAMMRGLERSDCWQLREFSRHGHSQVGKSRYRSEWRERAIKARMRNTSSIGRAVASFRFIPPADRPRTETCSPAPAAEQPPAAALAPMPNRPPNLDSAPAAHPPEEQAAGSRAPRPRTAKRHAADRPQCRRALPRRSRAARGDSCGGNGPRLSSRRTRLARPTAGGQRELSCARLYHAANPPSGL